MSTQTVARALGVSVTTVKRWVDDGVLPAHKTAGGHRKVLLADVVRLVHEGNWPHVDLGLLTGPAAGGDPPDAVVLAGQLSKALADGDELAARSLLHGAWQAGMPLEHLADAVVAPAMAGLGHGWEAGKLDVYQEHRGTQVCLAALLDLKKRLAENAGLGRPRAVGGGPERDHYHLANLLAEMVLCDGGWEAINVGPNTPMASLRLALRKYRPRLLWLSCSHLANPKTFLNEYADLYNEAQSAGVAVAVGGRALTEAIRARMPCTTYGSNLAHLAAFARRLHPRPCRPRRGRPLPP